MEATASSSKYPLGSLAGTNSPTAPLQVIVPSASSTNVVPPTLPLRADLSRIDVQSLLFLLFVGLKLFNVGKKSVSLVIVIIVNRYVNILV